jgi:acyl carrier protein
MRVASDEIVQVILDASRRVMEDLPPEERKAFTPSSKLIGGDSPLDSLGLVGLVIEVQEAVRTNFGAEVQLADERALSQPVNPFSTVSALAQYVQQLLLEAEA